MEVAARRQALRLAARAVEQWLNADTADHAGPELPCPCGRKTRYAGRHSKTFESALGPLRLERAYYHCAECEKGFCPRDQALGLEQFSLSPAVLRMVGTAASMVSFQESSTLLDELAGVQVDAKQVERAAEALGAEIAEDERRYCEPLADTPLPATLYLGIDGTGVPVRASELEGRAGKQPDGSAKTRDVKLCTVWSAESRDSNGTPVRDRGSISYSAAIESAATRDTDPQRSDFAERVWREATRRRFFKAKRQVVLGDGAPYNWNIADELFPQATQILDRYHAKEYLCGVAKAIFGADEDRLQTWVKQRHEELDSGRSDDLLAELTLQAPACDEARRSVDYVRRNRERMRYDLFHAQGLCTSTGVVEAGCKVAIGTRLKRTGMHWTVRGANVIIALRCCRLSGRFEDFWERRSLLRTGQPVSAGQPVSQS